MKQKIFFLFVLFALLAPVATQAQQQQSLTVHDGTEISSSCPAYISFWDEYTRTQCIFPASELAEMNGATITSLTFYTTSDIPYTSLSEADVYLMEVDYTDFWTTQQFEPRLSATVVYHGTFDFVSAGNGGQLTITFTTPYVYHGGNLLIGTENTTRAGYSNIYFYGQLVDDCYPSYAGYSSSPLTETDGGYRGYFLPKTTFTYTPSSDPSLTCPSGQVCLGVGTGTDTHLPFYSYYNYSLTEQIYTADEIYGDVSTIGGVSFYSLDDVTRNLDIYLVNTTKSSFNGSSDWIATDVENRVFSGAVTFTADSWTTITFDHGFDYSGDNIALIVVDFTGNYEDAASFRTYSGGGTQSKYTYSDESGFDPANPPASGTMSSVKNCVRFLTGSIPDNNCEAPVALQGSASPWTYMEESEASFEWTGEYDYYNVRYRPVHTYDPNAPATIILEVGNLYGDGTGYQMLLDPTATAYGTIIPGSGPLTESGDASDATYAAFAYKIPADADGAMTTEHIVLDDMEIIRIPAGTYDWCITNPTPDDCIYIANNNGNVAGRYDNFVFEPDMVYHFTGVDMTGGINLTVTPYEESWIKKYYVQSGEIVSGNFTYGTTYEWQVQGVSESCEDGVTEWSEISTFQTDEPIDIYREEVSCGEYNLLDGDDNTIATYTESGSYEEIYVDYDNFGDGLDYYWVRLHLDLTIVDHWGENTVVASCGPYTWSRNSRTYDNDIVKTYTGTADDGCPIRDTLTLTIVDHWGTNTVASSCGPYYWDVADRTYNKGGKKSYTGTADDGCPVRDTLNLTIVDHWGGNTAVTSCGPYTWATNGKTYNKGGKKSYTGTADDGCPIRDTLNLTIVDKWTSHETVTSCGPYTWAVNGKTYNKGGVKTYKGTADDGCPIYDTLTLTVASDRSTHVYVNSCGPYTWAVNGKTYSKSGTKTYKGTTEEGCAARDTLTLTIVDKLTGHEVVTSCGPYTWAANGKTYNKSGTKTYKGTSPEGCPIYDTLTLTVLNSPVGHTEVTNCGPYTWATNGKTYNKGGVKTYKGTTPEGCPIRDTLILTIVDRWSSYSYDTNCGPYTWSVTGKTYNKGGIKTYKGTAADGCPKYDTLNLTIVDRWTSHEYVTNCGPYTWAVNGKTYNKSGVKTSKGTAADGCPTYDTLTLTINNCDGSSNQNSQLSTEGRRPSVEPTLNSQFSIYPNPTTGLVHIDVKSNSQLSTLNSQLQVEVLDLVGRRVALFENRTTLDLSNLAEGTYTVRITTPDGVFTQRVIKK